MFALIAQLTITVDAVAAAPVLNESVSAGDSTDSSAADSTHAAAADAAAFAASSASQSSVSITDGGVNTRRTNAGSCAGEVCHDLVYDISGISQPYTLECFLFGRNSQRTYSGSSWSGSWSGRPEYGCYRYASYCGTIYVEVNDVRSNTISINQPHPDAPARPTVSAGNRRISVSWSVPSSPCIAASSYEVQWRRSGGSSWSSRTTSSRTYTISGLADGTTYEVRVRARNSIGWGSYSSPSSATTQQAVSVPGRVARPSVSAGDGSLSVSWSAPSTNGAAISSYEIRWRRSGSSSWSTRTASRRSYAISGLEDATSYEVQVRARNSAGWGSWSSSTTATTQQASVSVPGKVARPSVSAGDGSLSVSWSAPDNGGTPITDYDIRWGALSNANWHDWEPSVVSTSRQTTIPGLTAGTDFKVSVRAKNSVGAGPWSDLAWGTPTASVPSSVAQLWVTAGAGSLNASWSGVSPNGAAVDRYELRWRRSGGSWSNRVTSSASYTISGLAGDTSYEVQVRARNSAGWGSWSSSATATTQQASVSVPGRVTGVSVTADISSLTVSWSAPGNGGAPITDYDVRYVGADFVWRDWEPSQVNTTRRTTITGLIAGVYVAVQVRAKNSAGAGQWSGSVGGTPLASVSVPDAVAQPSVTAGAGSLSVSWSAPDANGAAVDRYRVQWRRSGSSSWSQQDVSARSYTISGLRDDTAYEVQVRARNSEGWGPWSSSATATTRQEAASVPEEVTRGSVTPGNRSLTFSWDAPVDGGAPITDYDVRWRELGSSVWKVWEPSVTSTSRQATITGLMAGTAYELQVRAKNSAGAGPWSGSVGGTPTAQVTVPHKVTGLSVVSGDGSLTAAWDRPADGGAAITDYDVRYWDGAKWVDWAPAFVDTSPQATITGLADGRRVAVQVRARNSAGPGPWSDYVWESPSVSVPGKVTGVSVTSGDKSLTVSWNAPAGNNAQVDDYIVSYGESANVGCGDCGPTPTRTSKSRRITITGLTPGTEYAISVRARNSAGTGPWSDHATATPTGQASLPGKVTGLSVSAGPSGPAGVGSLVVSWNTPSTGRGQLVEYEVYYAFGRYGDYGLKCYGGPSNPTKPSGCGVLSPLKTTTSRQFTINGLRTATPYLVSVRARYSSGPGEWSDPVYGVPISVPDKVRGLSLTPIPEGLEVTWDKPGDNGARIVDYDVGYYEYGVGFSVYKDNQEIWKWHAPDEVATSRQATITSLSPGEYAVFVRARNSAGTSEWSDLISGTPDSPPSPPPDLTRPTVTKVENECHENYFSDFYCNDEGTRIEWNEVQGATGYEIVYWHHVPFGDTDTEFRDGVEEDLKKGDVYVLVSDIVKLGAMLCDKNSNSIRTRHDHSWDSTGTGDDPPGCSDEVHDDTNRIAGFKHIDGGGITSSVVKDVKGAEEISSLEVAIRATYSDDAGQRTASNWSEPYSAARHELRKENCDGNADNLGQISLLITFASIAAKTTNFSQYASDSIELLGKTVEVHSTVNGLSCGRRTKETLEQVGLLLLRGPVSSIVSAFVAAVQIGAWLGAKFNAATCSYRALVNYPDFFRNDRNKKYPATEPFLLCGYLFSRDEVR